MVEFFLIMQKDDVLERFMRFQQKQQLEREQRRVEMTSSKLAMEETTTTTETTSTASSTKALNSSIAPGKVRQMFDERRRGTGIDKSYPLKPLSNSNNNNQRSTSGSSGNSSSGGSGFITKKTTTTTINSTNRNGNIATNKISSTTMATKSLRKQQTPSSQQQQSVTTIGSLKKTPLNGRLNASSINERTTTIRNNNNNNIDNNRNDYADDVDHFDNHNNINNNDNNYNNDNDYNDDYVDNCNNENFSDVDDGIMIESNKKQQFNNGKSLENENHNNNLDEETFPDEMSFDNDIINKKLPNIGKLSIDERNNNSGGDMRPSTNIKLKPVITRKTLPQSPASTLKKTSREANTPNTMTTPTRRVQPNTIEKTMKSATKNNTKMLGSKSEIIRSPETPKLALGPPPPGMSACKICGRHFNTDRVIKHEEICLKASNKKRKVFDSTKHRVKGTEVEVYLRRASKTPGKSDISTKNTTISGIKSIAKSTNSDSANKKSNWRKKHEEFIAAIRAAKEVQKHLARGGKLSDLPPPPPSENPDYIQCPHCSRRFNEAAAHRHIPKCANMMHNKPKSKPTPKKKY